MKNYLLAIENSEGIIRAYSMPQRSSLITTLRESFYTVTKVIMLFNMIENRDYASYDFKDRNSFLDACADHERSYLFLHKEGMNYWIYTDGINLRPL